MRVGKKKEKWKMGIIEYVILVGVLNTLAVLWAIHKTKEDIVYDLAVYLKNREENKSVPDWVYGIDKEFLDKWKK